MCVCVFYRIGSKLELETFLKKIVFFHKFLYACKFYNIQGKQLIK